MKKACAFEFKWFSSYNECGTHPLAPINDEIL